MPEKSESRNTVQWIGSPGVKVYCHDWLQPGTIIVSRDIFKLMEEGMNFDAVFAKAAGMVKP